MDAHRFIIYHNWIRLWISHTKLLHGKHIKWIWESMRKFKICGLGLTFELGRKIGKSVWKKVQCKRNLSLRRDWVDNYNFRVECKHQKVNKKISRKNYQFYSIWKFNDFLHWPIISTELEQSWSIVFDQFKVVKLLKYIQYELETLNCNYRHRAKTNVNINNLELGSLISFIQSQTWNKRTVIYILY